MKKFFKWILKLLLFAILAFVVLIVACSALNSYGSYSFKKHLSQSDKAYIIIDDTKTEVSADDVQALKDVFSAEEFTYAGTGMICGFSDDYAVRFVNSKKEKGTTLCPALDKCRLFEVKGRVYEVSDKAREDFEIIVEKYGLTFPHI